MHRRFGREFSAKIYPGRLMGASAEQAWKPFLSCAWCVFRSFDPGMPQDVINRKMPALVKAAFVPPDSGIVGHLVARLFSSLYILEKYPPPVDPRSGAALVGADHAAGGVQSTEKRRSSFGGASSRRPSATRSVGGAVGECVEGMFDEEGERKNEEGDAGVLAGLRRNLALLSWASFYTDKGKKKYPVGITVKSLQTRRRLPSLVKD